MTTFLNNLNYSSYTFQAWEKHNSHWKGQSHPPTTDSHPCTSLPALQLCRKQLREPTPRKSTSGMLVQGGKMQKFQQGKATTPLDWKVQHFKRGSQNFQDPQFSLDSCRPDRFKETQLHSKLFHKSVQLSVTH